jgi:hypothetical protein
MLSIPTRTALAPSAAYPVVLSFLPYPLSGVFKRGGAPLFKNYFPLSCGTPRQERGIKGVRNTINVTF